MAAGAGGVGVIAEVADDLEKALLLGGGFEEAGGDAAEEALAGEFEDGVVFAGRPVEVTRFGVFGEGFVAAGEGAHVKPRENDVDGQVGDALFAKERLRLGKARGFKRPMVAPEFIVPHLRDFRE